MTTNTKEYTREYYLKNKDRMKEISRKWRRKNKEYFIAYRLKNKERMKVYKKKYNKEYRLKI